MPNNSIISKNKMLVKKNKSKKKNNKKFKTIKKGGKNRNYMKKKGKSVIKNKSKKVNRMGLKLKIYGGSSTHGYGGPSINGRQGRKSRYDSPGRKRSTQLRDRNYINNNLEEMINEVVEIYKRRPENVEMKYKRLVQDKGLGPKRVAKLKENVNDRLSEENDARERAQRDRRDIRSTVNTIHLSFQLNIDNFRNINDGLIQEKRNYDNNGDTYKKQIKDDIFNKMKEIHDLDYFINIPVSNVPPFMNQGIKGNDTLYKIMMEHDKEPLCEIRDVYGRVYIENDYYFLKRLFTHYYRYCEKCPGYLFLHPEGIKIKDIANSVMDLVLSRVGEHEEMSSTLQGGNTLCSYKSITIPEQHSALQEPVIDGPYIKFFKSGKDNPNKRFRTFHLARVGWPGDHLPLIFAKDYSSEKFVFVQGSENVSFELSNGFCPSFASGRKLMEVFRDQLSDVWLQRNLTLSLQRDPNRWSSLDQKGYYRIIKYILNFRNMLVGWSWGSQNAANTDPETLGNEYNLWIHFKEELKTMEKDPERVGQDHQKLIAIKNFNVLIEQVVDEKYKMFTYSPQIPLPALELKPGQYAWNMQEFTEPEGEECNYMDMLLSLFKKWLVESKGYSIELNWFVGTSGFAKMLTVVMLVGNNPLAGYSLWKGVDQTGEPIHSESSNTPPEKITLKIPANGENPTSKYNEGLSYIDFFESSNNNKDNRPVTSLTFYSHNKTVLTCCIYVHLPQSLYTINCLERTISGTVVEHWCPKFHEIINNPLSSSVETIIFVIQGDTNNLQKAYDDPNFGVLGTTFQQSFLNLQGNGWYCTIYPSGDLRTGTAAWNGGLKNKYIVNDSGLVMICTRK